MERTIRVTGKGKIAVKPDRIRLIIKQTDVLASYEGTIRESAGKKRELTNRFAKLGFESKALKTLSFSIDTEYESYKDRDQSWKRRLLGYRYTHRMKLEFPADNELLGRLLFEVARCPGQPEFDIEHTVSDPEAAKNELLAKAVADSRSKAAVLSAAAGVELGDIQLIDYSWGEVEFVSRPVNAQLMCDGLVPTERSYQIDMEADDIDVEDTVTVVWKIR